MTKSALTYAWAIIAVGTFIFISAALQWQSHNATAFGVCLTLALFSSTLKVRVAGLSQTLSPAFVFLLVSVATLSWTETVAIAVTSGLMQCLWMARTPPSRLQIGFAAGTMAISGGLTHGVTWGLAAIDGGYSTAVILVVAGIVLLITNTLIVSTILCLIKEAPFYTVWRAVQVRAVPYYLAGGLLANVWVGAKLTSPTGITLLAAISVYLLSICLREFEASLLHSQLVTAPLTEVASPEYRGR
jgi:hypothetical protein